jgi:hypothetical protein
MPDEPIRRKADRALDERSAYFGAWRPGHSWPNHRSNSTFTPVIRAQRVVL